MTNHRSPVVLLLLTAVVVGAFLFPAAAPVSAIATFAPNHSSGNYGIAWTDPSLAAGRNPSADPRPDVSSVTIPVGHLPIAVACDSANGYAYVANWYSNNVSVINNATDPVVGSIPVGSAPAAVVYDSSNRYVYVVNSDSDNVSVIDGTTNGVVASVSVGSGPEGLAYDSANGYLYVANTASDNVSVINTATNLVITSVPVGPGPDSVAYDSANGFLYVPNDLISGSITVINGTTDTVVDSIPVDTSLEGPAYDSANGYVYVAQAGRSNVTVINGTADQVIASIPVGADPDSIAYDPASGQLYVANDGSDNVSIIDGATDQVVGSDPVGVNPFGVAYDSENGYIYTANFGDDTATVLGAVPELQSATVSPTSSVLGTGESLPFAAAPACRDGTCPMGATYAWATSKALGSLNSTTAPTVTLTAGNASGSLTLFVNVTLNSRSVTTSAAITIVPGLTSVAISPSQATLSPGDSGTFNVTPFCSAGVCPSNVIYRWSLTNQFRATLNDSVGPSVHLSAFHAGDVRIYVNATALGKTVGASALITIRSSSSSGLLGLPGNDGVYLIVAIVAAVVVVTVLVVRRKKRGGPTAATPTP